MQGMVILLAGLFSACLAFGLNWLALIPWRRTRGLHWSEQARVYFPAVSGAVSNLWFLPALLTVSIAVVRNLTLPSAMLIGLAACIGTLLGTLPMDREVFPRITWKNLLRQGAIGMLFRVLIWFVFLGAIAVMPSEFNWQAGALGILVLALAVFWARSGAVKVGRAVGLIVPAPERLSRIVDEMSDTMKIPYQELWLVRSSVAQAYAFPGTGKLLFTERLLEILSDAEVGAIAAHELAHLSESKAAQYQRLVLYMAFVPWIYVTPAVTQFGLVGFLLLCGLTIGIPILHRRVSRRLEIRADDLAHRQEQNPGTYARALERLYQDGLLPVVTAKAHATHPHLYDRLIAAGVTPDFNRPLPAREMGWNGQLISIGFGVAVVVWITKVMEM